MATWAMARQRIQMLRSLRLKSGVYDPSLRSAVVENRLEQQVNDLIKSGWQPHGPIVCTSSDEGALFAQPMVRYG